MGSNAGNGMGGLGVNDLSGNLGGNMPSLPHATEYTLQGQSLGQPPTRGRLSLSYTGGYAGGLALVLTVLLSRCDALPPNRMASTRARSERVGD